MRTGPVAFAYLDDPIGLVEAAMAISSLTHYEDHTQEACAVWSLMVRHRSHRGDPDLRASRGLVAQPSQVGRHSPRG